MKQRYPLFVLLLALLWSMGSAQVKREREESITDLAASNTMGFGNIWIRSQGSFETRYLSGFKIEPYQAIGLGMSQNMSAWAGAVPFDGGLKKIVGKMDAHLKITLPWNDNLRLFGLAAQGDLVLSNEQDTIGKGNNKERPAYTPRLGITLIADADLIKYINGLPIKIYFNWSTTDNDRLLSVYEQQSFRIGAEWKDERHSAFVGIRYGLYKRITGVDSIDAKAGYDEKVITILPGVRYRPFDRISFLGTLMIAAGGSLKQKSALDFGRVGFRLGLELPIFFRETNTEAIRSMIFLEHRKSAPAPERTALKTVQKRNNDLGSLLLLDDGKTGKELSREFKAEDEIDKRDKEMKEKRKKINEELHNIEQLLE